MNPKARNRAMRNFVASLLQSELTARELEDLADDLTQGPFAKELADFIREAMLNLSDISPAKKDPIPHQLSEAAAQAFDLITRRRLSKKFVTQVMMLTSPWVKEKNQGDSTVRELLEKYFVVASQSEAKKFLNLLQGESADPYLKGISRRG